MKKPQTVGTLKPPSSRTFNDEEIRTAFQTFDLDKNMYIGASELRHVLSLIGENVSPDEIDEMIRLADDDGSGFVSFDGFSKLFTGSNPVSSSSLSVPLHPVPVNRSSSADLSPQFKNSNLHELITEFSVGKEINAIYIRNVYKRVQEVDQSHSGRLGYSEFLQVLESNDKPMMRKLFDLFDVSLLSEIEVKQFLVNLLIHSKSIKTNEKLKISFSLMRPSNSPPNAMDGDGIFELINALFVGYATELHIMSIEERVVGVLDSVGTDFVTFDQFMEIVKMNPDVVLPPFLVSSIEQP